MALGVPIRLAILDADDVEDDLDEDVTNNLDDFIATQPEAEAQPAIVNDKLMTPQRTEQQITARLASDSDAIAGTNTFLLMTPGTVKAGAVYGDYKADFLSSTALSIWEKFNNQPPDAADFGALVRDGATDNSAVMLLAAAAIEAKKQEYTRGGHVFRIPGGQFLINATIPFEVSRMGIIGEGRTQTALETTATSPYHEMIALDPGVDDEMLTNGDFADFTGWTGTNWALVSNKARHTAGSTAALSHALTETLINQKRYTVVFTVSSRTAGSVTVALSGGITVSGTTRSADGTFSQALTAATGNNTIIFTPTSDFDGDIDTITVQPTDLVGGRFEDFQIRYRGTNSDVSAIRIAGGADVDIENVQLFDVYNGVEVQSSAHVNIRRLILTNTGRSTIGNAGIWLHSSGESNSASGTLITDIECDQNPTGLDNAFRYGILVTECEGAYFQGGHIGKCENCIAFIPDDATGNTQCGAVIVANIYFDGPVCTSSVYFGGDATRYRGFQFSNCRMRDTTDHGMHFDADPASVEPVTNIIVNGCEFRVNGKCGVKCSSAIYDALFTGCHFTNYNQDDSADNAAFDFMGVGTLSGCKFSDGGSVSVPGHTIIARTGCVLTVEGCDFTQVTPGQKILTREPGATVIWGAGNKLPTTVAGA